MKQILILSLFFIFIVNTACNKEQNSLTYIRKYNLDFRKFKPSEDSIPYNWLFNTRYTPLFLVDNSLTDSIFTLQKNEFFKEKNFQREIRQRILLPIQDEEYGTIRLEGIGEHIKFVNFIIDGINHKEEIVFSDTVKFFPKKEASSVSKEITLKSIELLNLTIYVEGEEYQPSKFSPLKVDIHLGNKHIDDYPLRELVINNRKLLNNIITDDFSNIEIVKNQKILGLGESIHKSHSVHQLVEDIIMAQVRDGICKQIIVEAPLEEVLLFNSYIQNNNVELVDDVLKDRIFEILLPKLKEYNLNNEEKVKLFGMDYITYTHSSENTSTVIFDYLTNRYRNNPPPIIDLLSVQLIDNMGLEKILAFLDYNEFELKKYLSVDDYKSIRHIISLSLSLNSNDQERSYLRDSVMYINTKFLLDSLCLSDKQSIIYGHAVHLNPISPYPTTINQSFGSYLKKEYKDEYASVLITVGKGSVPLSDIIGVNNIDLAPPTRGSLEELLGSADEEVYYLPIDTQLDKLVLSRFRGGTNISQEFYPLNLFQRYKGVFFIKECINDMQPSTLKILYEKLGDYDSNSPEMDKLLKEIDVIINKQKEVQIEGIEKKKKAIDEIKKRLNCY